MSEKSFQAQGSVSHCYGCGPDNQKGFQIKSYWDGDEAVASWRPQMHHCAGGPHFVNGGVITTLIDCHSVNLAIANTYKSEGRAIGSEPRINCVTANINISFLQATPIDQALELRAKVLRTEGRKTWVECSLSAAGVLCAKAEVLAVRLKK